MGRPYANKLSPHFNASEFDCRNRSGFAEFRVPGNLIAHVPEAAVPALRRLAVDVLEPMREKFGACVVLSGYRTPRYNSLVGGARYSQHIYTQGHGDVACDVRFARGNPAEWAAHADRLFRGGRLRRAGGALRRVFPHAASGRRVLGGIGRYDGQGFVHLDNRAGPARWRG